MIDWALVIPKDLELEYKEKLHELEEEKNMSYVTSFERLSREEGLQQGRQETLALVRNLLKQKVPLATIKFASGLSEKEFLSSKNLKDLYLI